jgi:uncharacterized protein YfaQ (DUF2300 family)
MAGVGKPIDQVLDMTPGEGLPLCMVVEGSQGVIQAHLARHPLLQPSTDRFGPRTPLVDIELTDWSVSAWKLGAKLYEQLTGRTGDALEATTASLWGKIRDQLDHQDVALIAVHGPHETTVGRNGEEHYRGLEALASLLTSPTKGAQITSVIITGAPGLAKILAKVAPLLMRRTNFIPVSLVEDHGPAVNTRLN